ncbi:pectinesterase inhibitor domain-containing protein, partial [Ralstonia pseudosolanacearum]|uniref:pectinesterase inhibitor domain-containing protein n=1 Tax=Ralstonia pseudosolanacearum TaxID=1310165 RepID=UPI003CF2ECA1
MKQPLLLLLVISLTSATKPSSTTSSYIKSSCSITRSPTLCVDSLSTYSTTIKRNPQQIAQAALSVSLEQARSAKEYVVKMSKTSKLRGME